MCRLATGDETDGPDTGVVIKGPSVADVELAFVGDVGDSRSAAYREGADKQTWPTGFLRCRVRRDAFRMKRSAFTMNGAPAHMWLWKSDDGGHKEGSRSELLLHPSTAGVPDAAGPHS